MRVSREAWTRLAGLLVVGGLYAVSFFLPALAIPLTDQPVIDRLKAEIGGRAGGKVVSIQGPSVFEVDGYGAFYESPFRRWIGLAWCANPVLWVGCLLLAAGWWRGAAFAGCMALALGSVMVLVAAVGDPNADVQWSVADYRVGYWLWLGSMALLVPAALVGRRISQRQSPSADRPNRYLAPPAEGAYPGRWRVVLTLVGILLAIHFSSHLWQSSASAPGWFLLRSSAIGP